MIIMTSISWSEDAYEMIIMSTISWSEEVYEMIIMSAYHGQKTYMR